MAIPPPPLVTQPQITVNNVNDPLYIASSDHPSMVLTNTSFNGTNFHGWSRNNLNGLPTCNYGKMRECTCSVIEKFIERESNSNLIQLLMNKAMDPLPSVNKAYYIVQQIKKLKHVTKHAFEPTAFFASVNNKGGNFSKRTCTHCNQEGHIVDQCFEKIGYPDWDTPFNMGTENDIAYGQNGGVDQKLVVAICQEMMRIFQGKSGMEDRAYASTSQAGYPQNQKGYKLYNLVTKEVFLSRDVLFDEKVFPFKDTTPSQSIRMFNMPSFANEPFEDELSPFPNTLLPSDFNTSTPIIHNSSVSNTPDVITYDPLDPNVSTQIPSATIPNDNGPTQSKRPTRQSAKPSWLKYFVTPHRANAVSTIQYPLFSAFDLKEFLIVILLFWPMLLLLLTELVFIKLRQMMVGLMSMNKELAALKAYQTWTLTSLPSGHTLFSSKWLDVNNAFLHGYIDEEIYMLRPQGYDKAAKGQSKHDYSLFVKQKQDAKPTTFPLPTELKLSLYKGTQLEDPSAYRKLIGRLLYLTMTRPDISYAVQHLRQFVSAPKDVHMQSGKHLLRTKHLEIDYHFIRDKVQDGFLQTTYIPIHLQLADIMTKALGKVRHSFLSDKLGISYPLTSREDIEVQGLLL
nr:reverse transcriptase, RNA-dependent DNA polymerase [Tanacetum cinerariifolium]